MRKGNGANICRRDTPVLLYRNSEQARELNAVFINFNFIIGGRKTELWIACKVVTTTTKGEAEFQGIHRYVANPEHMDRH